MSAIEWGVFPNQSSMTMLVHDSGAAPSTVLDSGLPFAVHVAWVVPAPINTVIGGNFRIRVFAESMGPGPEQQIGQTLTVPAVPNQLNYNVHVNVPGNTLPGEGEGAPPISGMYKLVAVLQHMNPGPNESSGFAEGQVFLRTP